MKTKSMIRPSRRRRHPDLHKNSVRRSLLHIVLADSQLHQAALRGSALRVDPATHSEAQAYSEGRV